MNASERRSELSRLAAKLYVQPAAAKKTTYRACDVVLDQLLRLRLRG